MAERKYIHCIRCGRLLTDPASARRGIGPECHGKEPTARLLQVRTLEQLALGQDHALKEAAERALEILDRGDSLPAGLRRMAETWSARIDHPELRFGTQQQTRLL